MSNKTQANPSISTIPTIDEKHFFLRKKQSQNVLKAIYYYLYLCEVLT